MALATIRPSSAGTYTELTPTGAAENWQCVDEETSDSDATYVAETENSAKKDSYNHASMPESASISEVKIYWRARASSTLGTRATGASFIKSGATETQGTSTSLSTTYTLRSTAYTTDPNTSAAWTQAAVDALEIGVRLTGGTYLGIPYPARCTQVYIEVTYTAPAVAAAEKRRIRARYKRYKIKKKKVFCKDRKRMICFIAGRRCSDCSSPHKSESYKLSKKYRIT